MYKQSNPKIDIYVAGVYQCSTNWHTTCSDAKIKYAKQHPEIDPTKIKCKISKK